MRAFCIVGVLFFSSVCFSQNTSEKPSASSPCPQTTTSDTSKPATVRIIVVDTSGAVITGAQITLDGPEKKAYEGVSNSDGEWTSNQLEPGIYTAVIKKHSFKKAEIKHLEVLATKAMVVRIGLIANVDTEACIDCGPEFYRPGFLDDSVDTTSTSVERTNSGQLGEQVPLERSVQSLYTGP